MADNSLTTILFDLDGTLLPIEYWQFMELYQKAFAKKCKALSLDLPKALHALGKGVVAMMHNDGSASNKEVFWKVFFSVMEIVDNGISEDFLLFYKEEFTSIKDHLPKTAIPKDIIATLNAKGYECILATNPLFPRVGTVERLSWLEIDSTSFSLITTYEEFSYTKPHLGYYKEIIEKRALNPLQCLMVGNDVDEDMIASRLGMHVFLIDDFLINRSSSDLSSYQRGSLNTFKEFCDALPLVKR